MTGLLSHLIQHPPGWFWWPARPVGLYRFTQGLHVATGLAAVPLLGAKLWSVYPRLFVWPPVRGLAHAAERAGVAVLVAAGLFQVVSGVLNTAHWYAPMPFFFTTAHYWVAWLAVGALLAHIGVQLPAARAALHRARATVGPSGGAVERSEQSSAGEEQIGGGVSAQGHGSGREKGGGGTGQGGGEEGQGGGEEGQGGGVRAQGRGGGKRQGGGDEGEAVGRREVLVGVIAAAGVITVATIGQTVRPLAVVSVLAPRKPGEGPQGLPVNRTAAAAGVRDAALDPDYRLVVAGFGRSRAMSLAELAAMPQHTAELPIACVEGWSATATWTGVRLRDLVALVAGTAGLEAEVESLQVGGRYRTSVVAGPHLGDDRTLIALRLGAESLDLDHGFPARLIAPNRPGVLQTKWVSRITVRRAR
ncbi:molybdopterin-dependent oxidoreductase [Actinoplanes sp. CA-054009]